MPARLRLVLILVVLGLAATAQAASIVPVEDRRFNRGTGALPATAFPSAPFAPFASGIGNIVGDALHDSTLAATTMSGSGEVVTDGGGGAGGTSHFEIIFRVDESADYTFTGSIFSSWIDTDDQGLDLPVPTPDLREARLLQGAVVLQDVDTTFAVAGRLDPGIDYTLVVTGTNLERPFEQATWDFVFAVTPLPEPTPGALLLLAAVRLFRRRRTP